MNTVPTGFEGGSSLEPDRPLGSGAPETSSRNRTPTCRHRRVQNYVDKNCWSTSRNIRPWRASTSTSATTRRCSCAKPAARDSALRDRSLVAQRRAAGSVSDVDHARTSRLATASLNHVFPIRADQRDDLRRHHTISPNALAIDPRYPPARVTCNGGVSARATTRSRRWPGQLGDNGRCSSIPAASTPPFATKWQVNISQNVTKVWGTPHRQAGFYFEDHRTTSRAMPTAKAS